MNYDSYCNVIFPPCYIFFLSKSTPQEFISKRPEVSRTYATHTALYNTFTALN
jgi:hypothetical protein